MKETLIFSKSNKIPDDKKKLFIGKWLLSKKNKIKKYSVIRYEKKISEANKRNKKINKIYLNILKKLTPLLNHIHKENYNEKNWELLIHYFLYNYVYIAYDKWLLIKNLKKKHSFNPVEIFSYTKNYFLEHDTQSFFNQFHTDKWDDWLFSKIIKTQGLKFSEKKVNLKKKNPKEFNNLKSLKTQKFLFPLNNNKYFMKNLVLPKYIKLKLNLKLNKNIRFYNSINFKRYSPLLLKRKLFEKVKTNDKFERFIFNTLSEIFPRNYLENFKFIAKNLDYLNWPKNPKIIFTSFEHYFNDVFKIYTMQKKIKGTKLFILQHGLQGLNPSSGIFFCEQRFSDKYLTWGHKNADNIKSSPLFCTTTIGKKIVRKIKKDILLSYTEFYLKPGKCMPLPRTGDETDIYKNDIIDLLSFLIKDSKKKIYLKYNTQRGNNNITNQIKQRFKKLSFIKTNLKKRGYEFSNEFRLNIETTNSTGFIELLSLNVPVILITNKKFFDVKKEYKKYFDGLIKSNIIFFDTKKASDFIKLNINNIDKWWFDKFTQKKIKYFCSNICKYEAELDKGFDKIFNEIRQVN